jgi:tetratricopeptide (TPR) repeat protein
MNNELSDAKEPTRNTGEDPLENLDSVLQSSADPLGKLDSILQSTTDPKRKASILLAKASCYNNWDNITEARQCVEEAKRLASSDKHLQPFLLHADAYLKMSEGHNEESLHLFETLLTNYSKYLHQPENQYLLVDVQCKRGLLLAKLGRWHEARPILEEALTSNLPAVEKSTILCNLGDCSIMADDYEAAKRYYESAREMGIPKGWEARCHYYLGIAYAKLDLFHEAKQELRICESNLAEYGLRHKDLYQWLAFVSKRLGESDKAQEYKRLSLIA